MSCFTECLELMMSSMEILQKGLENKNQKERLALAMQILKLATRLGVGALSSRSALQEQGA